MSRNSNGGEGCLYLVLFMFVILYMLSHMIYRAFTFDTQTITPTSYTVTEDTREVFSKESEFRISDTWVLPHNRSTGKWSNKIDQAVTKNKAALVRGGDYDTTCEVKTWGVRVEMFSMYPTIYSVECK